MNKMTKDIKIACVGDIMPGGVLHGIDDGYVLDEVEKVLEGVDLRVGTLECAIGDEPLFNPEKMKRKADVIYAPNADLVKLRHLQIDCVSLANNHAFDLGINGLMNTIAMLDELKIAHCGAGRNLTEASTPAVFDIKGSRIAFLAFCDYRESTVGYVPMATESSPGMNPMYEEHVKEVLRKNRAKFDYLFVILHWGKEHTFFPIPPMKEFASLCIKEGADGIIGGHTHRIQPVVSIRHKPVFYSLGNFLFPDRYITKPRSTFYPDLNADTSKYPITDGYPYVEEPTFKMWKPVSRIGMIGLLTITDKTILSSHIETRVSSENIVGICPIKKDMSAKQRLEYKFSCFLVRLPFYRLIWYILRNAKRAGLTISSIFNI